MKEIGIKFIYFLGEHQVITFMIVLAVMINLGILKGNILPQLNKKNGKEQKACK